MKRCVSQQQGSMGLAMFALVGFFVAGGLFLATFITTQKAKTSNPRSNLRLSAPPVPTRAPLSPLNRPAPVLAPSPDATTEAEIKTPPATDSAVPTSPIPEL